MGNLPEYEVGREDGGWHIRERGQTTRGMTVTDKWLDEMGFGRLTRLNVEDVIKATMASVGGVVLNPSKARRVPRDMGHLPFPRQFAVQGRRDASTQDGGNAEDGSGGTVAIVRR